MHAAMLWSSQILKPVLPNAFLSGVLLTHMVHVLFSISLPVWGFFNFPFTVSY